MVVEKEWVWEEVNKYKDDLFFFKSCLDEL